MRFLIAEINKARRIIKGLDEGKTIGADAEEAIAKLNRYYHRDRSSIITRGEMMKENLGNSEADCLTRERIDELVRDAMRMIADSEYVGIETKLPIKAKRGRKPGAKPFEPAKANILKGMKSVDGSRFAQSYDYQYIRDTLHTVDNGYRRIDTYGQFTSEVARPFIKELIEKHVRDPEGGWVSIKGHNYLSLFQSNPNLCRFLGEQIDRGTPQNGHSGSWRIIPEKEFDYISTIGRFYRRNKSH